MSDNPPFDPALDALISGGHRRGDREEPGRRIVHDFLATGEIPDFRTIDVDPFCDVRWGDPTEAHMVDYEKGDAKFAVAHACLKPSDWIDLQYHQRGHWGGDSTFDEWILGATDSTVEWVKERVQHGEQDEIPTPTLWFQENGSLNRHQEGRSRGVAALKLGLDQIPVYVVGRNFR